MNPDTADDVRRHIRFKASVRELAPDVAEQMLALHDAGAAPDYARLLESVLFTDPPEVVFHTAPVAARAAIAAHGLRAADPCDGGNWEREAAGQRRGVYVGAAPDLIGMWSHWTTWDIWQIETQGLAWHHDRLNPGCWVLTDDVPAERLDLHRADTTWSPTES